MNGGVIAETSVKLWGDKSQWSITYFKEIMILWHEWRKRDFILSICSINNQTIYLNLYKLEKITGSIVKFFFEIKNFFFT